MTAMPRSSSHNNGGTVTNRYVHGSNAAADDPLVWYSGSSLGTVHYLHADHLGSIVAIASSSAFAANSYDECGINGSGNNTTERFGYTGQAWIPELGTYYYKARFYSPTLGRFLQTDASQVLRGSEGRTDTAFTAPTSRNGIAVVITDRFATLYDDTHRLPQYARVRGDVERGNLLAHEGRPTPTPTPGRTTRR
jgi:RHS repeat-associated protein